MPSLLPLDVWPGCQHPHISILLTCGQIANRGVAGERTSMEHCVGWQAGGASQTASFLGRRFGRTRWKAATPTATGGGGSTGRAHRASSLLAMHAISTTVIERTSRL